MMKKLASLIFLLDSLVIGLGAFGHGLQGRHLHAAIDQFPIEPDMHSMIYVVWYFVSGCMLLFGVTLLWVPTLEEQLLQEVQGSARRVEPT